MFGHFMGLEFHTRITSSEFRFLWDVTYYIPRLSQIPMESHWNYIFVHKTPLMIGPTDYFPAHVCPRDCSSM